MLFSIFFQRFITGVRLGSGPWHKLKAAFGFCLISRLELLSVRLHVCGTTRTIFFRSGSDVAMFVEVFTDQEYKLAQRVGAKRILDIGANAGFASLYLAGKDDEVVVLAVEPDPQNAELLIKNTVGTRISVLQGAVGGEEGARTFFTVPGQGMSSSFQERKGGKPITVQVYSLKSLLERMNWPTVDLIKFDVEGAEWEMFQGADLRPVKTLIGEYHEDLVGKTVAEFLTLFPDFQSNVRPLSAHRYSVFLERK